VLFEKLIAGAMQDVTRVLVDLVLCGVILRGGPDLPSLYVTCGMVSRLFSDSIVFTQSPSVLSI
jgi:hypothetical protein